MKAHGFVMGAAIAAAALPAAQASAATGSQAFTSAGRARLPNACPLT